MSKTVMVHAQQRWEYSFVERRTEEALVRILNELGGAGWELITVLKHEASKGTFWTAFLKRPNAGHSISPEQSSSELGAAEVSRQDAGLAEPPADASAAPPGPAAKEEEAEGGSSSSGGDDTPEIFDFKD